MSTEAPVLTWDLIQAARERIKGKVHRTPVLTSETLDSLARARLFFKCENLQKAGAFKARGATNAVFSLSDAEAGKGVATHSSGNHRCRPGASGKIARNSGVRGDAEQFTAGETGPQWPRYGGKIVFCEPTLEAREKTVERVMAETGATLIHPYNDLRVMAGQATISVELLEDHPDLDLILTPVSGGGLLSGVAVAAKAIKPTIRVIGVEPEGADDAARSFRGGKIVPMINPQTIADGLRSSLGGKTLRRNPPSRRRYCHRS